MRVVFDTNILVSALGWNGVPEEAFFHAVDSEHIAIITSKALVEELAAVLDYPKLSRHISDEQKYTILAALTTVARFVEPARELDVVKADPADNRVLECALEGKTDFIVTGDVHLLKLGLWEGIGIVTPERFLAEAAKRS